MRVRQAVGLPRGIYVSDTGRIFSCYRQGNVAGPVFDPVERFGSDDGGRISYNTTVAGKRYRVHNLGELVWNTFNPDTPKPKGWNIHHLNGDHTDNRLSNLWPCTTSEHKRCFHPETGIGNLDAFNERRTHAISQR